MKKLAIIALAAVAGGASALDLYDNGTMFDGVNGGQNVSIVNAPASSFGPSIKHGPLGNPAFQAADDFTVTGPGWRLTSVSFYSYQTNQSSFPFTRARFSVVSGANPNGGSVQVSLDTNVLTNGGVMGYRVANGAEQLRDRPIFKVTVTGLNTILNPGVHMLRWSLDGVSNNGPFQPTVEPFTYINGNGFHALANGVFGAAWDQGFIGEEPFPNDGRRMEFPFTLHGEVVPEPATMIALGAGIAAIAARRRRK